MHDSMSSSKSWTGIIGQGRGETSRLDQEITQNRAKISIRAMDSSQTCAQTERYVMVE